MFAMKDKTNHPAKIQVHKIASDQYTPVGILEQLNAKVLLESAYHETGKGKYSILLLDEAFTICKEKNNYYLINADNKKYTLTTTKKFLDVLEEFRSRAPDAQEISHLPLPLGGMGYLGYEFFSEIENIEFAKENKEGIYENAFIFGRNFMIFDHLHDEAYLISVQYEGEIENVDLQKEIDEVLKRINNAKPTEVDTKTYQATIISTNSKESFIQNVEAIKDEIYKGNLLQCVLSRPLEIESGIPPKTAYRNLRRKNPSPYMFYYNFGSFILFGASPEVMVKIKDNIVNVRPIAGTRKRGGNIAEDIRLEEELRNDPKELAEHLMLIDLARNDIGKIAKGGTVKVNKEMIVERYSQVMHLVSDVTGELDKNFTSKDAIYATFPAGTVSGAAKLQAIKTIELLEEERRGPYAGLAGYFEKNGDFDSCIVIRSGLYKDGVYRLQAGAGVVYDSIPELEYEETTHKMSALLNALAIQIEGEKP